MGYRSKGGHIGRSLSCADTIIALYFSAMNRSEKSFGGRSRYIYFKQRAQCARPLRGLGRKRIFPKKNFRVISPTALVWRGTWFWAVCGTEASTGSEGHGLSLGEGMAFCGYSEEKIMPEFCNCRRRRDGKKGSTWEAVMSAATTKSAISL